MLNLRPEDIIHKSYLNQLLMEIIDQPILAQRLAFKGGTCAAMLGYLDRFSIDLDFDVMPNADEVAMRRTFHRVLDKLGFTVKLEFEKVLFFQLRSPRRTGRRNTLKASASNLRVEANQYKVQYFPEIDRLFNSQTIETMFANKLVSVTDRLPPGVETGGCYMRNPPNPQGGRSPVRSYTGLPNPPSPYPDAVPGWGDRGGQKHYYFNQKTM